MYLEPYSKQVSPSTQTGVVDFWGTLLGVPGLIQAYRTCGKLSIENAVLGEKSIVKSGYITYDYTQEHNVHRLIQQFNISIKGIEQGIFPRMQIEIPLYSYSQVMEAIVFIPSLQWEEND